MLFKILSKYPSGYLYFIVARVIGLSVKPLFLMYLLARSLNDQAALLSEVFLFLSGIFVLFASPVHFEYYKLYFEEKKFFLTIREVFNIYISNLILHIVLVLPFIFIIVIMISDNIMFSILLTFFLLIEKSFDEIQRFLQFSKEFTTWSNIFILKNITPVFLTIIYIDIFNEKYSIYLYMLLVMFLGVFIFFKYIPNFIRKKIFIEIKAINLLRLKKYVFVFFKKYMAKYIQGLSRANILNVDKWIALWLYPKEILSELMLVGQFGNIINIGTNYATVSHRRSEFIHSRNNISTLLMGYKVPFVAFIIFLIVMVSLLSFDILTKRGISELHTIHILMIGLAYMLFAITQVLTEYLFWNVPMKKIIQVDIVYYTIIISGGIYLFFVNKYTFIAFFFLLGNILRFIAQFLYVYVLGRGDDV